MKLYHHPLSGHAHQARLFLSLLGVPHEAVEVDLKAGAHKRPEFLALNPFGQIPVLDDEGAVVSDSNAILVYLARNSGGPTGCRRTPRRRPQCSAGFRRRPANSPAALPPRGSSPCSAPTSGPRR